MQADAKAEAVEATATVPDVSPEAIAALENGAA